MAPSVWKQKYFYMFIHIFMCMIASKNRNFKYWILYFKANLHHLMTDFQHKRILFQFIQVSKYLLTYSLCCKWLTVTSELQRTSQYNAWMTTKNISSNDVKFAFRVHLNGFIKQVRDQGWFKRKWHVFLQCTNNSHILCQQNTF